MSVNAMIIIRRIIRISFVYMNELKLLGCTRPPKVSEHYGIPENKYSSLGFRVPDKSKGEMLQTLYIYRTWT